MAWDDLGKWFCAFKSSQWSNWYNNMGRRWGYLFLFLNDLSATSKLLDLQDLCQLCPFIVTHSFIVCCSEYSVLHDWLKAWILPFVKGTLWNLSSYEPLKMVIINHGLQTLTNEVIIPHSGWEIEPNEDSKPRDAEWTTVFKNTSGCLRWDCRGGGGGGVPEC